MAYRSPVYAELRNMIDLVVPISPEERSLQANWKADVLSDENTIVTEASNAPKQVATVVNVIRKGNHISMPTAAWRSIR